MIKLDNQSNRLVNTLRDDLRFTSFTVSNEAQISDKIKQGLGVQSSIMKAMADVPELETVAQKKKTTSVSSIFARKSSTPDQIWNLQGQRTGRNQRASHGG